MALSEIILNYTENGGRYNFGSIALNGKLSQKKNIALYNDSTLAFYISYQSEKYINSFICTIT